MKIDDVLRQAFAMPIGAPSYPPGPYRFIDREYLIITYRTDPDALQAVVPPPLVVERPIVKFEFIRMPDSTGFGDYTESGQVIPVRFNGETGGFQNASCRRGPRQHRGSAVSAEHVPVHYAVAHGEGSKVTGDFPVVSAHNSVICRHPVSSRK